LDPKNFLKKKKEGGGEEEEGAELLALDVAAHG
jgi:hypothetical protein